MTEDEAMMREAAAQFAQSVVLPRVQAMDDAGKFDDDIISAIFEQGFMGEDKVRGAAGLNGLALPPLPEFAQNRERSWSQDGTSLDPPHLIRV